MLIRVDPTSDRAIYSQVADSIRENIAAGRLHRGDTLPPAREVAASLSINVHTVLRGYQQLRDEGLVDLRRGKGASITADAAGLRELHNEALDLAKRGFELGISPEMIAAIVAAAMSELAGAHSNERKKA